MSVRIVFVCFLNSMLLAAPGFAQATAAVRSVERIAAPVHSAKTERLAPDRAKLAIVPAQNNAATLKLYDAAGKEVPTTISRAGAIEATIDPRRGYVLAPPTAPARKRLPTEGLEFPARYVTITPQGATVLGGLFLRPARVPLVWNDQQRAYATELFVGYEFLDGAERALAAPKTVTFFVEGSNARVEADRVEVKNSGGRGYQRVTLTTSQIDGDTHFVARVGPNDEVKSSVPVLREPGGLRLSLPSTELPAFGIGTGTLTVSLLARDGLPLAATAPIDFQLSSRRLRQQSSVTLPAGKSSVDTELRSTGYGADEITARLGNLNSSVLVQLVFPIAAVVAAFVGGALGGATRYLRNRRRPSSLLTRRIIEGMLVGVIVVAAAWAGLVMGDLSAGVLGTPFGAFVLAALGGYVGTVLLDRIAGKTFGQVKAN